VLQSLLLLLLVQADVIIARADPDRPAYKDAAEACKEVERILAASPETALEKLAPVFADGIEKRFKHLERRIFLEEKAQELKPYDFYPFHLRGRARLLAARKKKDEEARRLLIDAVADLQNSLARGATQSRSPSPKPGRSCGTTRAPRSPSPAGRRTAPRSPSRPCGRFQGRTSPARPERGPSRRSPGWTPD
jgi:hypothetical protein